MKSALSFSLAPQVLVQGEWLHVDPCEAAVGEKRMYVVRSPRPPPPPKAGHLHPGRARRITREGRQGWGKQHTYVVALGRDALEDVTAEYADSIEAARRRRDLSDADLQQVLQAAQQDWGARNVDVGLLDEWNAQTAP